MDIKKVFVRNIEGIRKILYLDVSKIYDLVKDTDNVNIVGIITTYGESFSEIEITNTSGSLTDIQKDDDSGIFFESKLQFEVPSVYKSIVANLRSLVGKSYLVVIEDNASNNYLLGSIEFPAILNISFNLPSSGRKAYPFVFSCQSDEPVLLFVPATGNILTSITQVGGSFNGVFSSIFQI